jgi:hypothetical protein
MPAAAFSPEESRPYSHIWRKALDQVALFVELCYMVGEEKPEEQKVPVGEK